MATVPVNPPQPSAQPTQVQNVYMMPVPQQGVKTRIIRPVPGVKCLSIATIVMGVVLVVLGIVAIVLKAHMSYIANPIWTGLLFLVTTGILGIFVAQKKNSFCMNIGFLVMTIISSVFAYQLMECLFFFATSEWYECVPGPNHYYYYGNCSPQWARVLVGVVILLCAIAALVLCIVSCSVTIYGTFTCCYNCCSCCRNSSSPAVQYSSYTGTVMTPMSGHGMQVMAAPQMAPQCLPNVQHQTPSQPMLVAATPPQTYPQTSPPAYVLAAPAMSTPPHAYLVTNDMTQATQPGVVSIPINNPATAPPAGNADVVENKPVQPPTTTPAAETAQPSQTADNPGNWEKF